MHKDLSERAKKQLLAQSDEVTREATDEARQSTKTFLMVQHLFHFSLDCSSIATGGVQIPTSSSPNSDER